MSAVDVAVADSATMVGAAPALARHVPHATLAGNATLATPHYCSTSDRHHRSVVEKWGGETDAVGSADGDEEAASFCFASHVLYRFLDLEFLWAFSFLPSSFAPTADSS